MNFHLAAREHLVEAVHAEYTKLRTLASTYWLLLGSAALTVTLSGAVVAAASYTPVRHQDTTRLSFSGIDIGQAIVAVLGVLIVSNEYRTTMMPVTLVAMPRRLSVLAAKAATLVGFVVLAGVVAIGGSFLAATALLPADGFTAAHGYQALSLANGSTLRAATGSVLYLVLVSLLSLGIGTAIRESATALAVVLGLLYLFPFLAQVVSDPAWHRQLEQIAPMTAGLEIQATTSLRALPIGPWAGLGVLALWAGAALAAGATLLRFRDA